MRAPSLRYGGDRHRPSERYQRSGRDRLGPGATRRTLGPRRPATRVHPAVACVVARRHGTEPAAQPALSPAPPAGTGAGAVADPRGRPPTRGDRRDRELELARPAPGRGTGARALRYAARR